MIETKSELYQRLLPKLRSPKPPSKDGRVWSFCPVPAHGDGSKHGNRSLSLHPIIGVNCFAGCSFTDILAAFGESTAPNGHTPNHMMSGMKLTNIWQYHNERGELIAEHGRFEDGTGKKEFKWRLTPDDLKWSGLRGLAISEIPLYNLDQLAQGGDVYLVEGEKAADTCVAHGIIAVSLPGGASQKEFGHSLDPLFCRNVICWPDNDDTGRALMQRVSAALPRVSFISPPVPPKGDAADYFAHGGTMDGLQASALTPNVEVVDDKICVEIPISGGKVAFEFTSISKRGRRMETETTITLEVAGRARQPYEIGLDILSLSQRDSLRRQLEATFGKDFDWAGLINQASQLCKDAYLSASTALDVAQVPISFQEQYRIQDVIPEGVISIFFGDGGSGKTYLMLWMAVCLISGEQYLGHDVCPGAVLYVDYEADEQTLRRRLHRLVLGAGLDVPEGAIFYFAAKGVPIADLIDAIARDCERYNIDVVIIDSAGSACGGKPEDSDKALGTTNAVKKLGKTVIFIAHTNRSQDESKPFGSVYWHTEARATFFVKAAEETIETDNVEVGIFQKKANEGRKNMPLGVTIAFSPTPSGPVRISKGDLSGVEELAQRQPQSIQIKQALAKGGMTDKEISEATGVNIRSVQNRLREMERKGQVVEGVFRQGSKHAVWGLTYYDDVD